MSKLSKEKKQKLFLALLGIFGAVGLLYTFVISYQQDYLNAYRRRVETLKDRFYKNNKLVKSGPSLIEKLAEVKQKLDEKEAGMVPRQQSYLTFFNVVDQFREKQGLGPSFLADMTQPEVGEVELLPRFPYKAAAFGLKLSGTYQEIGKFIAEFENAHPYMRIQNIKISPEFVPRQPNQNQFAPPVQKLVAEIQIVTLLRSS